MFADPCIPHPAPTYFQGLLGSPRVSLLLVRLLQEKLLPSRAESSTLNLLSTPSNGGNTRQKLPSDGVHRIRVDFKVGIEAGGAWSTWFINEYIDILYTQKTEFETTSSEI